MGNARDNAQSKLEYHDYIRVLRRNDLQVENHLHPSDLIIDRITETKKIVLKDVNHGNIACTEEEWSNKLNLPSLKMTYVKQLKEYATTVEGKSIIWMREKELSDIKAL